MELFLAIYGIGYLLVILLSIYADIGHYKEYKELPSEPNLLIGLFIGAFWPFAFIVLVIALIMSWFGIVYTNVISFLAK